MFPKLSGFDTYIIYLSTHIIYLCTHIIYLYVYILYIYYLFMHIYYLLIYVYILYIYYLFIHTYYIFIYAYILYIYYIFIHTYFLFIYVYIAHILSIYSHILLNNTFQYCPPQWLKIVTMETPHVPEGLHYVNRIIIHSCLQFAVCISITFLSRMLLIQNCLHKYNRVTNIENT